MHSIGQTAETVNSHCHFIARVSHDTRATLVATS